MKACLSSPIAISSNRFKLCSSLVHPSAPHTRLSSINSNHTSPFPPCPAQSSIRSKPTSPQLSARCRTTVPTKRTYATKPPPTDLERRIAAIPISRYRNFCIIAHVDHGKSTLSDRLLELTNTIPKDVNNRAQFLDKLRVEQERGITVKAQTCSMIYTYNGLAYLLHLVDTPGHVDFRAEVSRSYASCGGALLLVDASQGVQSQTLSNYYEAFSRELELIPVLNKVDLPSADVERVVGQIRDALELEASEIQVSAKTGLNVEKILPAVIERIPPYVLS